jgi:hypothetical protein
VNTREVIYLAGGRSPAGLRGLLRNLTAALCRKLGGSRFTALLREFRGGAFFMIRRSILNLSRSDIDDELPELDGVSRAFETLRTHAGNMACLLALANPPSRGGYAALQLN